MFIQKNIYKTILILNDYNTMPHEKHSSKGRTPKVSKGRSESPLVAPAGAKSLPSAKLLFRREQNKKALPPIA